MGAVKSHLSYAGCFLRVSSFVDSESEPIEPKYLLFCVVKKPKPPPPPFESEFVRLFPFYVNSDV
jgi:hypothetical protein